MNKLSQRLLLPLGIALIAGTAKAAPKKPAPPAAKPVPPPSTPAAPVPPAPAAPPAPPVPALNTWALLVGVSKYPDSIGGLNFPAKDATSLRDVLTDPKLGAVPADHVRLLANEEATAAGINAAVDQFLRPNVKPGDTVVVYLAGHGAVKGVGLNAKSYFLPIDVSAWTGTALQKSAVDLKSLADRISQLPASQFVVFVDACRNELAAGRGVKPTSLSDVMSRSATIVPQSNQPASAVTFFACSIGQQAFEDTHQYQHGVFTYWLLHGIPAVAAQDPNGRVDMSLLASYVTENVAAWAKQMSDDPNNPEEFHQTPEAYLITDRTDPVVLMRVTEKKSGGGGAVQPVPPRLIVATYPEGAQVTVDGKAVGAGTVVEGLPHGGDYNLRVAAPGYAQLDRSVRVQDGYSQQVTARLQPAVASPAPVAPAPAAPAAPNPVPQTSPAAQLYDRAVGAEARGQWEAAQDGYNAAIRSDPKLQPPYERLAALQDRRGQSAPALGTFVTMVKNVAPSVHAYSLLARAYAAYAEKQVAAESQSGDSANKGGVSGTLNNIGKGIGGLFKKKKQPAPLADAGYRMPANAADAATLAWRAGNDAVRLNPDSDEAQLALGLGLVATDSGGKNKADALAALRKAAALDPGDAVNQWGLGYGLRKFGVIETAPAARDAELHLAIPPLQEAVRLRPDYFDAQMELAVCYHLLDDSRALHQYEIADSYRGSTGDGDEVAGAGVAMSSLHQRAAQNSQGNRRQEHLLAAQAYMDDARELRPNLQMALSLLGGAGLSNAMRGSLPPEMQKVVDIKNAWQRGDLNSVLSGVRGVR